MPIKKFFVYLLFFSLALPSCNKPDAASGNDYKTLGSSAHQLLSNSPYSVLQIEIQYMPGFEPDSASVNNMIAFLSAHINKSNGIQIFEQQIGSSGKALLSLSDVVSIENKNRTIFTGNDVMGVHILITDSYYSNITTFATSYWNTSFCIFGKAIKDNSGGFGQISTSALMTRIFEHEFGHLMGLVGQGSPMQTDHQDHANGAHCNNTSCIMYYGIETSDGSGTSTGGALPSLDLNCVADIRANGGN